MRPSSCSSKTADSCRCIHWRRSEKRSRRRSSARSAMASGGSGSSFSACLELPWPAAAPASRASAIRCCSARSACSSELPAAVIRCCRARSSTWPRSCSSCCLSCRFSSPSRSTRRSASAEAREAPPWPSASGADTSCFTRASMRSHGTAAGLAAARSADFFAWPSPVRRLRTSVCSAVIFDSNWLRSSCSASSAFWRILASSSAFFSATDFSSSSSSRTFSALVFRTLYSSSSCPCFFSRAALFRAASRARTRLFFNFVRWFSLLSSFFSNSSLDSVEKRPSAPIFMQLN
mmetsp:Transcript_18089/g.43296  ORF Transcript_18089/g.43296 Transcript_18089/m.43296 type:complete len:291 (+) Transcript_18089:2509-3381(+)